MTHSPMKQLVETAAGSSPAPLTAGFASRHIGPSPREVEEMLAAIGVSSVEEIIQQTVPASIRLGRPLRLDPPLSETEALAHIRSLASKNEMMTSLIGMGYHDTNETSSRIRRGTRLTPLISPK
jgi:glycine dehydrogenase